MTRFEYINTKILTPDGIKEQIQVGILPMKIIRHFEIYCRFDQYKKQGYKISMAIFYTAEDFKITEDCVYKIKKSMEAEI
jgi:hypothetical protein